MEFRHQPASVHLRTFIDARYKMTIYRDRSYGEIFDLQQDPGERRNLWDDPSQSHLKCELFQKLAHAELHREPAHLPRIAHA